MSAKSRKRILLVLAATVLALLAAEIVLRARGVRPWRVEPAAIRVEPGGKLFQSHPTLGYTHVPGTFTVALPTGHSFHLTHGDDALRVTSKRADALRDRPEIWVFGCSFTHGWSLDDHETYPWLLQADYPDHRVVNFGTNGYGTIHSLIQFKEALAPTASVVPGGARPEIAVLAYADFHDKRNTFLRIRQKTTAPWSSLGPLVQPFARVDDEGRLSYSMAEVVYREFPLMRVSALSHYLETNYNAVEEKLCSSGAVSEALVLEFARIAAENEVKLILAGITRSARTREMLAFAAARGITTVDISVDLSVKENSNAPRDDHPSAVANRRFADALGASLRAIIGVHSPRGR